MSFEFSPEQHERYKRHIISDAIGAQGQQKLISSSALIIGAGGLGSPAALYLASCGVGKIGLVDSDKLELSNLHRQVLYSTDDIGISKVIPAEKRLSSLNPDVKIVTYNVRLTRENIRDIIGDYDIVLDCTDNFDTKYLTNDTCVNLGKPLVLAGIYKFEGQVIFVIPGKGPCYRCIFPESPSAGTALPAQEAGLLGSVPGVIGAIQATEALKFLIGIGDPLVGRLLRYDAKRNEFMISSFARIKDCPACGRR